MSPRAFQHGHKARRSTRVPNLRNPSLVPSTTTHYEASPARFPGPPPPGATHAAPHTHLLRPEVVLSHAGPEVLGVINGPLVQTLILTPVTHQRGAFSHLREAGGVCVGSRHAGQGSGGCPGVLRGFEQDGGFLWLTACSS